MFDYNKIAGYILTNYDKQYLGEYMLDTITYSLELIELLVTDRFEYDTKETDYVLTLLRESINKVDI